jgi:nitrogen fixation/metabolism regulation signal transduction histidine kinase
VLDEALRYGAAMTFRYVAILPAILVFLFGAQFLYYRARGGYKAVEIGGH